MLHIKMCISYKEWLQYKHTRNTVFFLWNRSSKSFLWNRAVCIYDTVSTSDICGQDIAKVLWVRGNVMVDPMEVPMASRKPTPMTGHLPLPAIAFCCVLWPGA